MFSILSLLLAVGSLLRAQSPELDYQLTTKWELTLRGYPLGFSFALCSDGSLYAIHYSEFQVISSDGKLVGSDSIAPAMLRAPAACTSEGHLALADRELSIFDVGSQGKLNKISSGSLKSAVSRLLVAPDGAIYGITADEHPSLVRISPLGKEEILVTKKYYPSFILLPPEDHQCDLIWDRNRQQLAYLLPAQQTIEFLQANTSPGKKKSEPVSTDWSGHACEFIPITAVADLPSGGFVRTEILKSEIADVFNKTFLEVLDSSSKQVARPISTEGMGFLLGSTNDGSLYFVSIGNLGEDGLKVVRRELIEVSSTSQN